MLGNILKSSKALRNEQIHTDDTCAAIRVFIYLQHRVFHACVTVCSGPADCWVKIESSNYKKEKET